MSTREMWPLGLLMASATLLGVLAAGCGLGAGPQPTSTPTKTPYPTFTPTVASTATPRPTLTLLPTATTPPTPRPTATAAPTLPPAPPTAVPTAPPSPTADASNTFRVDLFVGCPQGGLAEIVGNVLDSSGKRLGGYLLVLSGPGGPFETTSTAEPISYVEYVCPEVPTGSGAIYYNFKFELPGQFRDQPGDWSLRVYRSTSDRTALSPAVGPISFADTGSKGRYFVGFKKN